jgi:tetratricopeptide (TPR) repeat protein
LAVILYQLDKISPARDRCREARKIDKKNWRASLLLVKLAESSDKPKGILKDLIERFEDDAEWKKEHQDPFAEMLFSLGDIYWTRDKRDQADQWFNKCLLSPDSRYKFPFQILSKYHEAGRFKNVFESLKSIFKGGYLIPMMLSLEYLTCDKKNMHAFFQNAMQDKDALETIDSVYMKAIGSAVEAKDRLISFNLRHFYAGLLSTIPSPPKERILGLLENAARDVPYTGMDPADTFFLLGSRIGSIYLANAKRANDEEEAGRWLSKLSDIVPEQVSEDQMRLPLRLFAARYNKLYGNIDAARKNVHSTLKMAIELLSDGDDSNDLFAYMKIFFAALAFGDADNATTALAVMDIEAPDDDDDAIECSCQCGYKWKDATDMYWCMDCMTVVLTKDCTKRVQDPNTCTSVCDQGHGYLCISGWVCKAAKKFSKCQVPYKGDIITLKKWKSYLTHEYKLKK